MSDKSLMLLLPEVSYFVDRIPIAKVVLKPSAVHLRFMQHARDSRMSLKKQCEALNIPWHARKVPAGLVHKDVLKVARVLSASTFCQTMPSTAEGMKCWLYAILRGHERRLLPHAMRWLAHNGAELPPEEYNLFPYLRYAKALAASTPIDVVTRRAEKWRARARRPYRGGRMPLTIAIEDFGATIEMARRQMFAGVDYAFRIPNNRLSANPQDRTPIEYPDSLLGFVPCGGITVTICRTPEDFRKAGEELCNCIDDRNLPRKSDYFAHAKAGRLHIAIARRGGEAIAAFEFAPDWTLATAFGPRNRSIIEPEILTAARVFSNVAKASTGMRGIDPTHVTVDEMLDNENPWAQAIIGRPDET